VHHRTLPAQELLDEVAAHEARGTRHEVVHVASPRLAGGRGTLPGRGWVP
jgi:hypothetical protein